MSGAAAWHLSDEVLVHIFGFLPAEAIGRAARVCSRWASVAKDWRVWHRKSYLLEDPQGLSDALLVARTLPVLKKVSICQGNMCKVYLSWESADFLVPDLRDEVVRSAVSSLATENLSIDFVLLEETSRNCLVVQLHRLKGLRAAGDSVPNEVVEAKLKALATTLSDNPLPDLQSIHISTYMYMDCAFTLQEGIASGINESCGIIHDEGIASGILRALSTCPALCQLSLHIQFSLPCHAVPKLSNIEVVELKDCNIELLSFLSLCPNLRNLKLIECYINMGLELSQKFALRSLFLRNLVFDSQLLNVLCLTCPQLDRLAIDNCSSVRRTLCLGHCLPSTLRHLRLSSMRVSNDSVNNIVQRLRCLETLDVRYCELTSLRFLRHCAGLNELSVGCYWAEMLDQYQELGCLKNLHKLNLIVSTTLDLSFVRHCHQLRVLFVNFNISFRNFDLHELTNLKELRKVVLNNLYFTTEDLEHFLDSMPQMEEMDVGFAGAEFNFSFLDHCRRLTALGVKFDGVQQWRFAHPQCLECMRRLVLDRLPYEHLPRLVEVVRKMPRLEYLGLSRDDPYEGPNVLESWDWRRAVRSDS